jgi:aryl-alcohol dehydrogenase-like predicted oxidoreductase
MRIVGTDLDVSAICCGAGAFDTAKTPVDSIAALYEAFRHAGGNFFDTAHCYGFWIPGGLGSCERYLGQQIRKHGDTGKVVVATKGGHPAAGPAYPRPGAYLAPEVIASDITESLDRLGVGIDLYLLHRDDSRVPVGEIIDALNAEIARGRIRHIGASNWTTTRIAQANQYAASHSLRGFVASQVRFSLAEPNDAPPTSDLLTRYLTDDAAAWHQACQMAVMAFSPTACGYFATGGAAGGKAFDNPTSRARLAVAKDLAGRLNCTVNQVALAYLMCQDFPVIPIIGTGNVEHLTDAMAATDVKLQAQDVRRLRQAGLGD